MPDVQKPNTAVNTEKTASTSGEPASDQQLSQLFSAISDAHIIQQMTTVAFNRYQPNGLYMSLFTILSCLDRCGDEQTPQRLCNELQIAKASLTNSLARLEERGLVKIKANPEDKRSKLVSLTAKGKREREAATKRVAPALQRYLAALQPGQLDEIAQQVAVLRAVIEQD